MQLASKMRFISAQLLALLEGDLWRACAGHANAMAARLADGVREVVQVTQPVQANGVFAILPPGRRGGAPARVQVLRLERVHRRGALDVLLGHDRGGRRRVRRGREGRRRRRGAVKATNTAGYEAPIGLTADPVVFTLLDGRLCVLLARRLEEPQRGMFSLPGGFVGACEAPEQTAERKLREKTGVGTVHLEQLRTYADPARDPRGWLPSIAYMALVRPETLPEERAGRARRLLASRRPAARLGAGPRDDRRRRDLAPARARGGQGVVRAQGARAAPRAVHVAPGATAVRGAARRSRSTPRTSAATCGPPGCSRTPARSAPRGRAAPAGSTGALSQAPRQGLAKARCGFLAPIGPEPKDAALVSSLAVAGRVFGRRCSPSRPRRRRPPAPAGSTCRSRRRQRRRPGIDCLRVVRTGAPPATARRLVERPRVLRPAQAVCLFVAADVRLRGSVRPPGSPSTAGPATMRGPAPSAHSRSGTVHMTAVFNDVQDPGVSLAHPGAGRCAGAMTLEATTRPTTPASRASTSRVARHDRERPTPPRRSRPASTPRTIADGAAPVERHRRRRAPALDGRTRSTSRSTTPPDRSGRRPGRRDASRPAPPSLDDRRPPTPPPASPRCAAASSPRARRPASPPAPRGNTAHSVTGKPDGAYVLTVRATDFAGNVADIVAHLHDRRHRRPRPRRRPASPTARPRPRRR